MTTKPNFTEIVQAMYAAFGRGDVAFILARVHPDAKWGINADPASPGASRVTVFRPFVGPTGVADFFSLLGHDVEFHAFEPTVFVASGSEVVARVTIELTVRRTQRRTRFESMHAFTFDASGKLTRFREYTDTLAVAASWDVVKERAN